MLTRIEIETMNLIKAACREYIDNQRDNEIDWEQRRYEIAKECYARQDVSAEKAVMWADRLIEELKKRNAL